NLPKPNCATFPSDCADIDVLNTLDGFNLQPRISIPFTGPIDPASVNSSNVFLVSLGSTTRGAHGGKVVGINQIVWEPATNTLHAESDELLDQHTRYALVVTRDVRDAAGGRIEGSRGRHGGDDEDFDFEEFGDQDLRIAALSIFTTQSVTSTLEKIRASIKHSHPAPATIHGTFPLATLTAIQWQRQVGTAPPFASSLLPTPALSPTVVSHGGGARGTLTVLRTDGPPVTFPDGGRGIDQDGNGRIDSTEGVSAAPPRDLIGNRDGLRQTVVDLMQLVRVIETGGIPGLD